MMTPSLRKRFDGLMMSSSALAPVMTIKHFQDPRSTPTKERVVSLAQGSSNIFWFS